jgi:hypothetical protein
MGFPKRCILLENWSMDKVQNLSNPNSTRGLNSIDTEPTSYEAEEAARVGPDLVPEENPVHTGHQT